MTDFLQFARFLLPYTMTLIIGAISFKLQEAMKENKKLRANKRNQFDEEQTAFRNALRCLLKVKLIEYHDKYVKDGSVPPYVLQNYDDMYNSYHALGGNGMITQMYEELKDLPIRT